MVCKPLFEMAWFTVFMFVMGGLLGAAIAWRPKREKPQ